MKLSVHLVTWNGEKYIPHLFESLKKQSYADWTLLVIDNNSGDGTVELIKKESSNFLVKWKLIENKTNLGFAGGHNQAFRESESEYVLLLNQDMYLAPDCLEKVVMFLDQHPEAASVSPRLMKWDFPANFTEKIEALGIKVYPSRRVVEQYTQQNWSDLKKIICHCEERSDEAIPRFGSANRGIAALPLVARNDSLEVFGVSGALPALRRSAIKNVAYPDGSIFDESYHSYKEDVDLAWRLAVNGQKSYVLLDAVAYHDRSAAGPKQADDASALANKKQQSEWVKYHSYKNHLMTLYKNEYWQNFALDFPWILWYELKKFVYFLLFDRHILGGLKEIFNKDLAKKRRLIKSFRKISWQEMRKWWP